MSFCTKQLQGYPHILSGVLQLLTTVIGDGVQSIELEDFTATAQTRMSQPDEIGYTDLDGMPLDKLVPALVRVVTNMKLKKSRSTSTNTKPLEQAAKRADGLSRQIVSLSIPSVELCLIMYTDVPVFTALIIQRAVPTP